MDLGDFAREAGANRAITVGDSIGPRASTLLFDRRSGILNHLFREPALIKRVIPFDLTGLRLVCRNMVVRQQATQIQFLLTFGITGQALQQVNATHKLFQGTHAQLGHPLPGLFGHEAEEIHRHFHRALEVLFTEVVVLCSHTGRAVIQVTDTQVFTTQRNHRGGTETEALGTKDRAFYHVQTCFQAAISLQANLATQVIGSQRLLGFGKPQLPGRTGVADRRQRARRCTAIVPGHRDQVGVRLSHTCGNRTDAGLRDQLHRHQSLRIDLFEIENQLGQILDGIDIVMRRR